jgi:hypothetical protein
MKHLKDFKTFESLIQKSTLDQLKRVKSMMKGIDIDDKVRTTIDEGPKRHVDPLKTVQTYQQYMAQPFKTNQNIVTQVKESIEDIYSTLNDEYGEACNVKLEGDSVEIHSPMKYIVDDLSEKYGGEVKEIDDYYFLKIK